MVNKMRFCPKIHTNADTLFLFCALFIVSIELLLIKLLVMNLPSHATLRGLPSSLYT